MRRRVYIQFAIAFCVAVILTPIIAAWLLPNERWHRVATRTFLGAVILVFAFGAGHPRTWLEKVRALGLDAPVVGTLEHAGRNTPHRRLVFDHEDGDGALGRQSRAGLLLRQRGMPVAQRRLGEGQVILDRGNLELHEAADGVDRLLRRGSAVQQLPQDPCLPRVVSELACASNACARSSDSASDAHFARRSYPVYRSMTSVSSGPAKATKIRGSGT